MSTEWLWLESAGEPVQVLARSELWGRQVVEVVVPSTGRRVRLPAGTFSDLASRRWQAPEIVWRAAVTRALALTAEGEPLFGARRRVALFPHQRVTLERALAMDPVRLAICDEVGLGKTVTAGAVLSEMKARGRIRRSLIVAPKGMQLQWVAEMADRFGEEFVRVGPEGMPVDVGASTWQAFDQVICSFDSVKPMRRRAGWSPEKVEEYNRLRFEAIVNAGWDLVVIDEAHHVAGSSEEVARYQLGTALASKTENLLLLSATPHSGKSDGFRRFLGLVDDQFVHGRPVERSTVAPLVARTEKRRACDDEGQPLFQPRTTEIRIASYSDRPKERELYEAVTEYVRTGWNAARRQGRNSAAFLVLLMQRLVSSSTAAILRALEKRSAALGESGEQLALFQDRRFEWDDLTGEEQYEVLVNARGPAWETERTELNRLLGLAREVASSGADAKARVFFDLMVELRRSERDANVKALVFTEFVATQEMLVKLAQEAGMSAVAINGSMGLAERVIAQDAFRDDVQLLVSTEAGGEGINLQFAHVVVNWDLPWSPSRLEQRIGRVDRIGQARPVRAFNLVCESSVEARVLEVLDEKLSVILAELGADKRGDILESASRHSGDLWSAAILTPDELEREADRFAASTREEAAEAGHLSELIEETIPVSSPSSAERLASLVETATSARTDLGHSSSDPQRLLSGLPEVAVGEPCPVIRLSDSPNGWFSVWEVTPDGVSRNAVSFFESDAGEARPDRASRLWDRCCVGLPISDQITPSPETWSGLVERGIDHAYISANRLSGDAGMTLPDARLRLLVRVES